MASGTQEHSSSGEMFVNLALATSRSPAGVILAFAGSSDALSMCINPKLPDVIQARHFFRPEAGENPGMKRKLLLVFGSTGFYWLFDMKAVRRTRSLRPY